MSAMGPEAAIPRVDAGGSEKHPERKRAASGCLSSGIFSSMIW